MINTTLYNPASLNEEDLISSFVVRTKTFEKIFKDLESSKMLYPEKHYLLQGQRGMGKTTLLLRLKYEVERNSKLHKRVIPVFFNEETYDVNSLSGLWEKLLKYLDDYLGNEGEFYNYTEQFLDAIDYEKKCFEYLIEQLRAREKKLIIFFDNFGELFLDNLRDKEKRRLREILMDCSDIRIVAASAVVINDLHDYSQPFYEFFHIVRLEGLDKDETYQLIIKLQEGCQVTRRIDLKKSKAKIETLSILTGGVIRTILMLYQVLLDDRDGSALEDLEKVLDKVTPLYKHRIEDLPVQQRRIVDVIAKKWDAVSTKEIAVEIRENGKNISTKLVSAQLNQLERNNIVEKKETNTKNHLYQLRERFFNIWYLMRNGDRREKRRVAWLTKFLEMWYSEKDELSNFVVNHVKQLKTGNYKPTSALLMIDALLDTQKIELDKMQILYDETKAILGEELRKQLPSISKLSSIKIMELIKAEEFDSAMNYANKIEDNPLLKLKLQLIISYKRNDKDNISGILKSIDFTESLFKQNIDTFILYYLFLGDYKKVIELNNKYNYVEKNKSYDFLAVAFHMIGDWENEKKYAIMALKSGKRLPVDILLKRYYDQTEVLEAFEQGILINEELKVSILDYLFERSFKDSFDYGKTILATIDKLVIRESFKLTFYELLFSSEPKEPGSYEIKTDLGSLESLYKMYNGEHTPIIKFVQNFLLQGYLANIKRFKNEIKKLIGDIEESNSIPALATVSHGFLVAGKIDKSVDIINEIIKANGEEVYDLNLVFIEFLAQKQYHQLLNIFNVNNDLKEKLKPTYYALMSMLKDEFPNEILKMGVELESPVNEILVKVKQMQSSTG